MRLPRPAVRSWVDIAPVREFVRSLGVDPADAVWFSGDQTTIRVEVVHRDADGNQVGTPDGERVTYEVVRDIIR